ncbi:MAG: hypothetical protein CL678_15070 [Bdellovibrionaceae bacterium]|nr:hypothetical protein [Pseudobdellovibrionaceae bacterium]|tara:strand:- start:9857 stop:10222 length:366 start_codon:yes stop_codon:yes gene_type:complete
MNFSGDLFHYSSGNCVKIDHDRNRKNALLASRIPCPKELKKAATEPYIKISDFKEYKNSFQSCLKKQNKNYLRPLVSKTLQINLGMEPLMEMGRAKVFRQNHLTKELVNGEYLQKRMIFGY